MIYIYICCVYAYYINMYIYISTGPWLAHFATVFSSSVVREEEVRIDILLQGRKPKNIRQKAVARKLAINPHLIPLKNTLNLFLNASRWVFFSKIEEVSNSGLIYATSGEKIILQLYIPPTINID